MILTATQASGHARALARAVAAAAPNLDHPPLDEILALLYALDPAVSGAVLGPFEVDPTSGMPAWPWVERVRAEGELAAAGAGPSAAAVDEARILDRALGERLEARRRLHAHLQRHAWLPPRRTGARLVRAAPHPEIAIVDDRVDPNGRWVRTTIAVRGAAGARDLGLATVRGEKARVAAGVEALLDRHAMTPLRALHAQLADAAIGSVDRVTRGAIGPAWIPGSTWPAALRPPAGPDLALHLTVEALARDLAESRDRDPLAPPTLGAPPGFGLVRTRRFAATPAAAERVRASFEGAGEPPEIALFHGGGAD